MPAETIPALSVWVVPNAIPDTGRIMSTSGAGGDGGGAAGGGDG